MNTKKMLINMVASIVSFVVALLISFVISPYVVSKLGEEAYGFLNLASSFVSYATLVTTAVNSMASRFISVEFNRGRVEEAKKFFASVFIVNCVLYAIILMVSLVFIYNLQNIITISPELVSQVKITFLLSFLNLGFSMMGTVYTAAVFSTNNMHWDSALQIVVNVVKSVLIFALFLCLEPKIYFMSIAILAAGIITFAGNYIFTKKLLVGFEIKLSLFDVKKIKKLIQSGSWVLLSHVSNMLLNGFDLLLCNQLISSAIMGRMSIAKQIPLALGQVLGSLSSIFTAALTETFAKNTTDRMVEDTKLLLRILAAVLSVPFAGVIIYGKTFLTLWLSTAKYTPDQVNQIYWIMVIALIDIIISAYMYSIHSVFIALNKVRPYAIALFVSSIISIVLTLILVLNTGLGVYAIVGTSTVVLGFTHGVIVPGYAAKLLGEKIGCFWKTELRAWMLLGLLSVVFYAISRCFSVTGWLSFFGVVAINGVVGYVISFFVALNKSEQKLLLDKLPFLRKQV